MNTLNYYHDRKKGNLRRKPIPRPFRWCNALRQMIHEAHLPRGKTDKNFTRIDWRAYHSTKVRLATFIWCNGRATCGMPVNSGEIFISFPLGKCASWIICRNALHHMKGLEIGFHPRFLFFSIMIII